MSILKMLISRRAFIKKIGVQLLAWMVVTQTKNLADPNSAHAATNPQPYGRGAYSQGCYPGNDDQIYLPFINKAGGK